MRVRGTRGEIMARTLWQNNDYV